MDLSRKIEIIQIFLAITIANFGEIVILITNELRVATWPPAHWVFTVIFVFVHSFAGYASYIVLKHGSINGQTTELCKAALILFSLDLLFSWARRYITVIMKEVLTAWNLLILVDGLSLIIAILFYTIKPKAALYFSPFLVLSLYITVLHVTLVNINRNEEINITD